MARTGTVARSRRRCGAALVALAACGGSDDKPLAPITTSAGGTGTSAAVTTLATSPVSSAGGGGADPSCEVGASEGTGTGSAATGGGFRFDVGAPDVGFSFPVDCAAAENSASNLGCEFWAVDLPNDGRGTSMSPPAADQQFAIVVSNPSGVATAEIEVFTGNAAMPVAARTVAPGDATTIELDPLSIDPLASSADGTAYRIVSSLPVTAYQFNPLDNTVAVYSNDASLLIPTHALGQSYAAATADAILLAMGPDDPTPVNAGAFVSVVAAQDGTEVEFDPTANLVGSIPNPVILDRGQVATILSSFESVRGNLSGTTVRSTAPVAVFAGNVATAIPTTGEFCCADHVEHQLLPHESWGTRYAVAPPPSASANGDNPAVYRIIGAFDDTELVYCPTAPAGAPVVIGAGETVEFTSEFPFTVRSRQGKAFSIVQFLLSFEAIGFDQPGDPAMIVIPAAAQFEQRHAFVVPAGYATNLVTVVAPEAADVRLDGVALPGSSFEELGVLDGTRFVYSRRSLEAGPHVLETDEVVGLSVFGYDEAVSYAFPGGAGVRVISIPPAAG